MDRPTVAIDMPTTSEPDSSEKKTTKVKRMRKQKLAPRLPQDAVNDFWQKYMAKVPGKVTTVLPRDNYLPSASNKPVVREKPSQSSFQDAVTACRARVRRIARECRAANRKYCDADFDLEMDLKFRRLDTLTGLDNWKPSADKDDPQKHARECPEKPMPEAARSLRQIFDSPKFFMAGRPTSDVVQGNVGDCWLIAAVCALSQKDGLLEKLCVERDEQVGVYGFVFYRDGEWISEIIDDKLFLIHPDYTQRIYERCLWSAQERIDAEETYRRIYQSNSPSLFFSRCLNANETWLPLLEKAFAKAHGDYSAIDSGWTGEAIEDLTGGVTTEISTRSILDTDSFWENQLMHANQEFLFSCFTGTFSGIGSSKGIVARHAYSVVEAKEKKGKRFVVLRNPHGHGEWTGPWSDGSVEWTAEWLKELGHKFGDDGIFYIEYDDFLKRFEYLDRTRLFDDNWKVATLWTTVQVSLGGDNLDTHFSFTLTTPGEVAVVLSQLDDRYFRGLQGQYDFQPSFTLFKASGGRSEYIAGTFPTLMTRSCSLEAVLEAGEYKVKMQLTPRRNNRLLDAADVIRRYANIRTAKLMRMGTSYDVAHLKGSAWGMVPGSEEQHVSNHLMADGCVEVEDYDEHEATDSDPDSPDELELDPWNAMAVVGLRVYHQASSNKSKDREIVTLKVVRSRSDDLDGHSLERDERTRHDQDESLGESDHDEDGTAVN